MYKLLLVTTDPKVLAAYDAVKNWEFYGFRAPRITADADGAIDTLKRHHADAISIALPEDEAAKLEAVLAADYPLLPIVYARHHENNVRVDTNELSHFLRQIYADTTDERYDLAENMRRMRHAFFRTLLSGRVDSDDAVLRRLAMLRSRMDPSRPCLLIRFSLPKDIGYLAGRWHYGNDRLEIALRNLFGHELEGMRLLESVLDNGQIYLLACPMLGTPETNSGASMTETVNEHVARSLEHVREYLSIDMQVESMYVLARVTELADAGFRASIGIA